MSASILGMQFGLKRLFRFVAWAAFACAVAAGYYNLGAWTWIYWDANTGWTPYGAPPIHQIAESLAVGLIVAGFCALIPTAVKAAEKYFKAY